jgi:hypothetical protein
MRISRYLIHIPNGAYFGADRKTAAIVMAKLKKQGLRPSVSDYFLALPALQDKDAPGGDWYHGLWLELKRVNAVPSDTMVEQAEFQADMRRQGYQAVVARGWGNAMHEIIKYLGQAFPIGNHKPEIQHASQPIEVHPPRNVERVPKRRAEPQQRRRAARAASTRPPDRSP